MIEIPITLIISLIVGFAVGTIVSTVVVRYSYEKGREFGRQEILNEDLERLKRDSKIMDELNQELSNMGA